MDAQTMGLPDELPDKLTLNYRGSGFEIVRRWLGWRIIVLTVFAVFWDGFVLPFWYSWYSAAPGLSAVEMLMALFHVAAGIGVTYTALAGWFNTTRIGVDQGKVTVRHGPLPWLGNKDIDGANLKDLYLEERVHRGRYGTTITYEVRAITATGKDEKLVGDLEYEQAFFIEHMIEHHFHIEATLARGQTS